MGAISTVDMQTRLDIRELLNRYCHYIDHDKGDAWASLFTPNGVFECDAGIRLEGRDQLRTLPGMIQRKGDGKLRHQITNILVDHSANAKEMQVSAYGMVMDWRKGGVPVNFYDYDITFRASCHWQIAHMGAKAMVRELQVA